MKNKYFLFDVAYVVIAAIILIIINEFELIENIGDYSMIIALLGYAVGKTVVVRHYKKKDGDSCDINSTK